uniref:Uncharacterized protein n=1 Tax=viral metagenome TaxID=1070528 RepID=A0A6C0HI80_9ZZZZ
MHTLIIGFIISLFLYFVLYELFGKESFKGKSNSSALKGQSSSNNETETIAGTNDPSYGLVEFSTVPFSSTSSTVNIGLKKTNTKFPQPRKVKSINSRDGFTGSIVGIKVPEGLKVTIYEFPNFGGNFNSIIGPSTVDNLETEKNLQYPETEDDQGLLLENIYKGRGWQNRVKSFIIHRYREIPDDFDGVFYTQKYGINNYQKFKALGGNPEDLPEKTREDQWQHYIDNEYLGRYAINEKALLNDDEGKEEEINPEYDDTADESISLSNI